MLILLCLVNNRRHRLAPVPLCRPFPAVHANCCWISRCILDQAMFGASSYAVITPHVSFPTAGNNGGGGAIGLQSGCTDLCTIRNNSFVENQAEAEGGAIYLQVGYGQG